jgi:hypothetical protein
MVRPRLLWFAILVGPLAWLVELETKFALVPWTSTCPEHRRVAMLAVAGVALILTLAGVVIGLRAWGGASMAGDTVAVGRARFMATLGASLCVLFVVVIVATAVPAILLDPCG